MKNSVKRWVAGAALLGCFIGVEVWRRVKLSEAALPQISKSISVETAWLSSDPLLSSNCIEWPSSEQFDLDAVLISLYKLQSDLRSDFMMEAYLSKLLKTTLSASKALPSTQYCNARSKISLLETLGIDGHWLGSDVLNAFAVGLNHIFVHSKILLESRSEMELNLVLAHELGHLVCQHTDLMLKDMQRNRLEICRFLSFLNYRARLTYSRDLEFQADKFAFDCLVELGYNPADLCEGLDILMRAETVKYHELSPEKRTELEVLQTHPLTMMRINRLRDYAKSLPRLPSKPETLDFQLLKLRELISHSIGREKSSAADFERLKQLPSEQEKAYAYYGLALTYLRNLDFKKACQSLEEAPKLLQEHPFGWELKFLIHKGLRKPWSPQDKERAIQSFESFYGMEWAQRFGAQLDLFEGKSDKALARLKSISSSSRWGQYWHELAKAYHAAGKPDLCRWALAEYNTARGELKQAQLEFHRLRFSSELNSEQKREVQNRERRLQRLIEIVGI